MIEPLALTIALIAGMLLGVFFFGGLWWTVRKGLASERPALLFSISLLVRTAVVLSGFYLVMGDNWQKPLAALLGFALARVVVTRLVRTAPLAQETDHAS